MVIAKDFNHQDGGCNRERKELVNVSGGISIFMMCSSCAVFEVYRTKTKDLGVGFGIRAKVIGMATVLRYCSQETERNIRLIYSTIEKPKSTATELTWEKGRRLRISQLRLELFLFPAVESSMRAQRLGKNVLGTNFICTFIDIIV
ncbi:hypothetical protein WN51_09524 [Melipona quadrifasciata]|uniref:Uncharacterized protein n=1 Tax=Melipona quadrifasciata TaxID=166423 RepID=A0A0M9A6D5_9HYME|nr:hypothetical protein WN51_09524 [Melipona quadrifasciata]